jgi:peptide/nickel transport system substrate-binding protein
MSSISRRQFVTRTVGGAVVLGVGGAWLSSCGGDDDQESEGTQAAGATEPSTETTSAATGPRSGGNLRVAVAGGLETDNLDPNTKYSLIDFFRQSLLYQALGERNHDFETTSLMLEEATASDGVGQVWDIRLREGIEFHHGKSANADDLLFSLRRVYDPDNPGFDAALNPYIDPSAMERLDDRTVRLTLTRPVSILPELLHVVSLLPTDFDVARPVGAGPFKFESFTVGDRAIFSRFDNYFGQAAYLDQVEIIDVADSTAQINALLSDVVDALMSAEPSQMTSLTDAGMNVVSTLGQSFSPFCMRSDIAPFNDVRVRQAFRLIPDRARILEQVYAGHATIGNDLYAAKDGVYATDLAQREQDLDQARALLAEAGMEGMSIDLPIAGDAPATGLLAQTFADMAKDAGVTVNIIQQDGSTWGSETWMVAPFYLSNWFERGYLALTTSLCIADAPYNEAFWVDDEFEDLYSKALETIDEAARAEITHQMQEIQYDRGGFIIPALANNLDVYSPKVAGMRADSKGARPFNNSHVEELYITE